MTITKEQIEAYKREKPIRYRECVEHRKKQEMVYNMEKQKWADEIDRKIAERRAKIREKLSSHQN